FPCLATSKLSQRKDSHTAHCRLCCAHTLSPGSASGFLARSRRSTFRCCHRRTLFEFQHRLGTCKGSRGPWLILAYVGHQGCGLTPFVHSILCISACR